MGKKVTEQHPLGISRPQLPGSWWKTWKILFKASPEASARHLATYQSVSANSSHFNETD